METALTGHERIDRRSLALHGAIAEKVRSNPGLLAIAHDNLERWSRTAGRSQPYLDRWRRLLELPLPELLDKLTLDTEEMRAMRQSTPFAGILSPQERWAIYARFPLVPHS